jgi:hypothetical protein
MSDSETKLVKVKELLAQLSEEIAETRKILRGDKP